MNATITTLDLRLRRRAVYGYAVGLALYTLAIVALYPSFENDTDLDNLVRNDATMMAAFGVSKSLTSPAGWLEANLYNNFLPLIVLVIAIGYGASCIAGQDENGTLALQAALPLTRRNMLLQKVAALTVQLLPALALTYLFTVAGRGFDVSVSADRLAVATVTMLLLGIDFGALALLVGALTGRRGTALAVASAVAAASYLLSSLAPTVAWLRPARIVSLFYWAVGRGPLDGGPIALAIAVLVVVGAVLTAVAAAAFERLDLH